jgi:hypothetical protein
VAGTDESGNRDSPSATATATATATAPAPAPATFNEPHGLCLSRDGKTLFVSNRFSHRLRAIALGPAPSAPSAPDSASPTTTGCSAVALSVTTIAGSGEARSTDGPALSGGELLDPCFLALIESPAAASKPAQRVLLITSHGGLRKLDLTTGLLPLRAVSEMHVNSFCLVVFRSIVHHSNDTT